MVTAAVLTVVEWRQTAVCHHRSSATGGGCQKNRRQIAVMTKVAALVVGDIALHGITELHGIPRPQALWD